MKVTNTAAAAYRMDARRGDWAIEYGKDKADLGRILPLVKLAATFDYNLWQLEPLLSIRWLLFLADVETTCLAGCLEGKQAGHKDKSKMGPAAWHPFQPGFFTASPGDL